MSTAMKSVIVGTAGHIDHGKSTLVEALTGTHPDRLAEEKRRGITDRKSTRLNSSHLVISYAVFCLKKKKKQKERSQRSHSSIRYSTCDAPRALLLPAGL